MESINANALKYLFELRYVLTLFLIYRYGVGKTCKISFNFVEVKMKRWLFALLFALWVVPGALPAAMTIKQGKNHAATWKKFNEQVDDKVEEIKSILFGPFIKILGVLGIAVGVFYLTQGKTQHMMTWAGIGLLLAILPTFIDTILGAMLPRM